MPRDIDVYVNVNYGAKFCPTNALYSQSVCIWHVACELEKQGVKMNARNSAAKRREMTMASDYQTWRTHAIDLDAQSGMDVWKSDPNSPFYQYKLIQQRLINLRHWRKTNDWPNLIYSLREGLHRNLGNLANPELYQHTRVGTKYLIDEYINEVTSLLNYICDHPIPDFSSAQKLLFFRHTGQSFGRSALMLSGGANMGMFHMGVIKALMEQKLMPRVISGSSAGSVVAALVGTRKDSDLPALFRGDNMEMESWRALSPREMIRQRSIMDIGQLEHFLRNNIGEYTFEEAFKKTKRIINVTVSAVAKNQHSRLLNYLTTPHLLVWSAVLASCSVPGLFPPVRLTTKDQQGNEKPYMASVLWVDGALQSDLPAQRLGELYNVNHHIVSQTNPHVLPFITDQYRKPGWTTVLTDLAKGEVQFRSKQIMQLASVGLESGILKNLLESAAGIVDQRYYGDVTIHPTVGLKEYAHVLGNQTLPEFQDWVRAGERATWPKIALIRDQTVIGQTLENCIIRLKKHRSHRASDPQNTNTIGEDAAD
jgi:TAG lipase/steryl ester hydrolase/phospholipase A2/LPA acyltransferase